MPAYTGYKDYQQRTPPISRAGVGEKMAAFGSGIGEGVIDMATLPVRLGSIAADQMGFITPQQSLNNIQMLDNASYAPAEYMDNRQAMRNNPNTAMLGNMVAPVPPMAAAAKRLYGARFNPINKNFVVKSSDRGVDSNSLGTQSSNDIAGQNKVASMRFEQDGSLPDGKSVYDMGDRTYPVPDEFPF